VMNHANCSVQGDDKGYDEECQRDYTKRFTPGETCIM
jgi:hypothetical protein